MMDMHTDDHGCQPPYSRGLAFLRQDVGHMRKVKQLQTREARLTALLLRASQALAQGDKWERVEVAMQIETTLAEMGEE